MATVSARPDLLRTGLRRADRRFESHRVFPGAATAVTLHGDDRVRVVDLHGGQVAELTVVGTDGSPDGAALGLEPDAPATVLRALLADDAQAPFVAALRDRGLRPEQARAARLFGPGSPRMAGEDLLADRDATLIVAAPAGRIVEGEPPGSELRVEVQRTTPRERPEPLLPEPLAEPRLDLRIDRATAQAYEVRAGEYIQILDVQGQQCSDFLAFHRAKLEAGVERGLDATITRTLMGNAYPTPGLQGKFYDVDMDPLVEIVRDTVGRHDTFALACQAKYYEDLGYPGHVNCTDNFNREVAPYGIAPRRGWEALNFFYNTEFDRDNLLLADEPWSRPGDYVLVRAMTDLVCSSSACPDDIDPANAWECTDIHVRVYPAENTFSMATAHRVTPDADPELTKETAFHPRTSQLTRDLVEYRGYWLPACFPNEGPEAEYWACREHAAVIDLSPLRKWEILGPDAEALMQLAVTRDVRRLAVGQVVYTAMCNETGGMVDDATVFKMTETNFRFIGGDPYDGVHLEALAQDHGLRAYVKPSTDELHNLAVQGPSSRDILRELIWTAPVQPRLEELRWFRFCVGRIGGPKGTPVVVSRTGYSGELGYEVFCHPGDGPAVWDAIWEAGAPYGLKPLGLAGLDLLRIESGLIFAGYEFDDQVDPFEAGISFTVALDHEEDFVGRTALVERKAHPQRRLVGLELEGNEVAGHGDCVHAPGVRDAVGVVTSAMRSPILRRNIALCRMAVQHAEEGTAVEVGKLDGQMKRIPARVVGIPFYDPEKKRPRS